MLAVVPRVRELNTGITLPNPRDERLLSKKYLPEPIFRSVVESLIAVTLASSAST